VRKSVTLLLFVFQMLTLGCKAQVSQLVIDDEQCEKNFATNPDLALPHCTALVESRRLSQEDLASAFIFRGVAYTNKGDFDRAIQDFDQAIRLQPNRADAFNSMGMAIDYKRDYDRAIKNYDEAIRLKPDYADAFNNRGLVYEEKGDSDRAIQDFDQAIRLRPAYAEALDNRAGIYLFKGDYDRAIQDYGQAIKAEPNNAGNFNDRGIAFNGKKDYQRALQDLDQAVEMKPRDASILGNRGVTNFFLGQFKAAEDDLALSVRLMPTDPTSLIWLYVASSKSGENAVPELRKNSAVLKSTGWPLPVIQMYLHVNTSSDVLVAAKGNDAIRNKKQLCQAYFFLGEDALFHGNLTEAKKLFQEAIATRAMDAFEFMGASAELDRINTKAGK
jgi:lipoprotein NlpI